MDTMQKNNKKNQKSRGIFSFLFREDDRLREKADEPQALCAPLPGSHGVDVNCIIATQSEMLNHVGHG